jgi:glycine/D-amino acid oxidase-like deaminating enzyme/nitrite reductase/ring-hydroxylating ferredoxin subunit
MTLTSVWEDGLEPGPRATPVEGHQDVIVVGGGLTGVTTALLLASAGRSVLVVEARHVGAGTTGGSTAKVSALQGTRLSRISRRHPDHVVRHYVSANEEGRDWLRRFAAEHAVATQSRTASTYATTEQGARAVRREHDVAVAAGLPVRLVSEIELPFPVTAAVELDDQVQLDPLELVRALAHEAVRRGARIVEGVRVRGVHAGGPCRVDTPTGTATADTVVVATNMPVLDRGAHFARLKPQRSYSVAFEGDGVPELGGMHLSADPPGRSVRDAMVRGRHHLLVGGEGHVTGRGAPTSGRLEALRRWTAEHFGDLRETHAWSAQDYQPAHELPLVGPVVPGSDRLLIAGGYAKWGMSSGAAAALALSSRILGGHTEWADAMAAWSRRELTGLPSAALFNAEVGAEMARGWLAPLTRVGSRPEEGEGLVRLDGLHGPTALSRVADEEHRVSAVCTHLGGVVRWNDAERSWDCPLHGSRFGHEGEVLEGPATCRLARR